MEREEREKLARKRIVSILNNHAIATMRTLEQKISDAGPYNQRIDPHILTTVRNQLMKEGRVVKLNNQVPWYHLNDTPVEIIKQRLAEQLPIFLGLQRGGLGSRIGQCLEIAIFRALLSQDQLEFLGYFNNLDKHDDSRLYSKEEPPQSLSGLRLEGDQRLDFLVRQEDVGWAGMEAKNVREWLYPNRSEITELIEKAVALDIVPILIARRIPFVTFKVLSTCGVVFHQTYNQLYPDADRELAEQARNKDLLGYHDIRIGNEPDERLLKFIGTNLPQVLLEAREKFDEYKDLLADFAYGEIEYAEFAARVRRRTEGTNEDSDWEMPEDGYYE